MSFFTCSRSTVLATALLLGAAALPVVSLTSTTFAQDGAATRVEPYVVVFTATEVPVRSGNSTIYYPICFPKQGDTLVVDAETSGWLRVMYPAGVRPMLTPDEVQVVSPGTLRLTKASKLKAHNTFGGIKGSFQPVLETESPVGTEFKVADTLKDDSGNATAYLIEAPAGARGWVSRDAVRRATESEAAPVMAKLRGSAPSAPSSTPAPAPIAAPVNTTPAEPVKQPAEPAPTAVPAANPPAGTQATPPAAEPPAAPVTIPTTQPAPATTSVATPPAATPPAAAPVAQPVATPPGMEIPAAIPVGDKEKNGGKQPRPVAPAANSIESLKAIYDRVRAQPLETAELEQAIGEFEKFRSTLGSTPRDASLAKQIDAYTAAMKMRKEIRDLQASNATTSRETELLKSEVGKRVIELEKQRVYNVIGRLVRSTVYDGGRTPVLYRVMSPEPGSARTLGYLLPDPKFDYSNKLDQVVGIIGEVRSDESLRTNLIVPQRVDVVSLAPIVVSPDIPGVAIPAKSVTPAKPADKAPEAAPADPAKPATEMPKLPSGTPGTIAPPTPSPANQPEKP